jgi:23S rRNA (adenine2030-N6)-methyltransferase
VAAVREALQRFAEAVILVWIPQLQLVESAQLPQRLQAAADAAAPKGWLHARLTVTQSDERGFGLIGSSMLVINPPYVLHDMLQQTLPWLTDVLGQYDDAHYLLEQRSA